MMDVHFRPVVSIKGTPRCTVTSPGDDKCLPGDYVDDVGDSFIAKEAY